MLTSAFRHFLEANFEGRQDGCANVVWQRLPMLPAPPDRIVQAGQVPAPPGDPSSDQPGSFSALQALPVQRFDPDKAAHQLEYPGLIRRAKGAGAGSSGLPFFALEAPAFD
jgi:hypothetical protein